MDAIISITAFVILALLWLAFGLSLLFNRSLLPRTWQWFCRLPLLARLGLGLLLLPVVIGMWIWSTRLPLWLRLAVVIGLGWMTVYTFFPHFPLA